LCYALDFTLFTPIFLWENLMQPGPEPTVGIVRIYAKDLSFELPSAPGVFKKQGNSEVNLQVAVTNKKIDGTLHEVVLRLTVEAKSQEGVDFIAEVEHAGLFDIKGASALDLEAILNVFCPTNIFPYARQAIDTMLLQGSLPPLHLGAVNFDAIWRQRNVN